MCLIGFAWHRHPRYALILAANRDEFHARATDPLAWWPGYDCLAGRDRVGGGTWLGVTRSGHFAALTNFREPVSPTDAGTDKPSRGELVTGSLNADPAAQSSTDAGLDRYAGFNLIRGRLTGPDATLAFVSNRDESRASIAPGIYGLSNGAFDAAWPKAARLKSDLAALCAAPDVDAHSATEQLRTALGRPERATGDDQLPDTGLDIEIERRLSAAFILGERYGTRCSTILLVEHTGRATMTEYSFVPDGSLALTRRFVWRMSTRDHVAEKDS